MAGMLRCSRDDPAATAGTKKQIAQGKRKAIEIMATQNQMTLADLPIGTEVYNGGDMANAEHFGVITDHNQGRFGTSVEITPEADSCRSGPYWVTIAVFSRVYLGHGGTRFVTKAEYERWRGQQLADLQARYREMMAAKAG